MTVVAVLPIDEAHGWALVEVLGESEVFASLPLDFSETAPGRWEVVVYFEEKPDGRAIAALSAAVKGVLGSRAASLTIRELPETDWVRRSLAELRPIRIGRI